MGIDYKVNLDADNLLIVAAVAVAAGVLYFKAPDWAASVGKTFRDAFGSLNPFSVTQREPEYISTASARQMILQAYAADARLENIPAYIALAVIRTESDFNKNAVGRAGEVGLMQMKPSTYTWLSTLSRAVPFGVVSAEERLFHASTAIRAGLFYLYWLWERYDMDMKAAVIAYNCGQGNYDDGNFSLEYYEKVLMNTKEFIN